MPYAPRVYRVTLADGSVSFEADPAKAAEHAATKGVTVEKCLRGDVDVLSAQRKAEAEAAWAKIPETPEAKRKREQGGSPAQPAQARER